MMPEEEDEEEAKEIEEIDALWKCCETFRRLCEVSFSGSAARMPWEWLWRLLFGVAEEDNDKEEEGVEALWWLCSAP